MNFIGTKSVHIKYVDWEKMRQMGFFSEILIMSCFLLVLSLGCQICEYPDPTLFQPDRQRAGGTSGVFTGIQI